MIALWLESIAHKLDAWRRNREYLALTKEIIIREARLKEDREHSDAYLLGQAEKLEKLKRQHEQTPWSEQIVESINRRGKHLSLK